MNLQELLNQKKEEKKVVKEEEIKVTTMDIKKEEKVAFDLNALLKEIEIERYGPAAGTYEKCQLKKAALSSVTKKGYQFLELSFVDKNNEIIKISYTVKGASQQAVNIGLKNIQTLLDYIGVPDDSSYSLDELPALATNVITIGVRYKASSPYPEYDFLTENQIGIDHLFN